MSLAQKREAATALQQRGRTVTASCQRVGLAFSTWKYERKISADQAEAIAHIKDLAFRFPRFGYRRITQMLKREGRAMNHKRVQRLCQLAGLQVQQFWCASPKRTPN